MIKYTIILVFYFGIIIGEECDDNVCYRGVKKELERLSELYNKSPSVSNIPSILNDIYSLINKTKTIILNIKNIDDVKNKSHSTYDTMSHSSKKLELIRNVVDELNLINTKLDELKLKKDIRNNAFNECLKANKLYETLRDDVEHIKQIGKDMSTPLEVSKRIDEIKRQSLNIKNNLDELGISDSLFQNYVCSSRLQSTVQDIINGMEEIANMLQTLFEGIIKSKLMEIEKNNSENEQTIKNIEKNLGEKLPTTDVIITDETRPTLQDIRKQIDDLKNKIKQIKLDKTVEDVLEKARKHLKDLINEYEIILNHIFSKQNMEKVKEEIETARETLRLLEERDAVKAELESVKQVVDMLKDRGVCFINETVSVEDKIIPH